MYIYSVTRNHLFSLYTRPRIFFWCLLCCVSKKQAPTVPAQHKIMRCTFVTITWSVKINSSWCQTEKLHSCIINRSPPEYICSGHFWLFMAKQWAAIFGAAAKDGMCVITFIENLCSVAVSTLSYKHRQHAPEGGRGFFNSSTWYWYRERENFIWTRRVVLIGNWLKIY